MWFQDRSSLFGESSIITILLCFGHNCRCKEEAKADGSDIHMSQTHFIETTMSEKCGMLEVYYEVFETK